MLNSPRRFALLVFACALLISIVIVACSGVATLDESRHLAKSKPTTTQTQVPPSPTQTSTSTSTSTLTLTPSPTKTATPEPTSTPTPLPTSTPVPATPVPTEASEAPTPTSTYPPPPSSVHVPILMYHYVSELPPDADQYRRDLTVPPAQFEAQLRYLQEQGYRTVKLADVYETLTSGKPLPDRPIVLTFDDGYKDAYTHAYPLLDAYGFTGEFFVLATPAHYEAPNYLTWSDMRAMADAGLSIQAHGRDHYDLTNRDYDFLVYQILGAREAVEAHTDQPVRFFCYPSGRYDGNTQKVVASAGYWGAVTTAWGTELSLENRYAWPRVRVKGAWTVDDFASVLSSLATE